MIRLPAWLRPLNKVDLLQRQLEAAEHKRIEVLASAENYMSQAMQDNIRTGMLAKRIERLKAELAALAEPARLAVIRDRNNDPM